MNRTIIVLFLLVLLFRPIHAFADTNWVIENFSSHLAVSQSGVVHVVETIAVDFRNTPQYGIYRDIPYENEVNGKKIYTQIVVNTVLQNNVPAKYSTSESNGYEVISIGDPSVPLTGRNVYTITYTLTGIVQQLANNDVLNWNVTGFNWPVEIEKTEAAVLMPGKGIQNVTCNEGPIGYTSLCQSNIESYQVALFSSLRPLSASEGLTIAVNFEKGLVPVLTAQPPLSYGQKLLAWPAIAEAFVISLAGFGMFFYIWHKYTGNVFTLFALVSRKRKNTVRNQLPVKTEFFSPENLMPAEMSVLIKKRADSTSISATIITLAARGFLQIVQIPKKWQFGKVDYLFIKSHSQQQVAEIAVNSYERQLLTLLFYKRKQVKLSSLRAPFYQDLVKVKSALYHDMIIKKLFPFDPENERKKYQTLALLLGFFGLCMLYYGVTAQSIQAGEFGIGLLVDSVLCFTLHHYLPERTPYGTVLYQHSLGFIQFIKRAQWYKQRFTGNETLITQLVPYAMLFGLTQQFGVTMDKIGIREVHTGWFAGAESETMQEFTKRITLFADSLNCAIGATPTSGIAYSSIIPATGTLIGKKE